MSREISEHQIRRIDRADAGVIARLVNQDAYWTESALGRILKRIELLNQESPQEACQAAENAVRIVKRLRDPHPDLVALTVATHGTALRYAGQLDGALSLYRQALAIPGLTPKGRASVLQRMAVALVCRGDVGAGLESIQEAIALEPGDLANVAVRAWVLMVTGDLHGSLFDSLCVLEKAHSTKQESTFLAGIINAANVLRFEGIALDPAVFERLDNALNVARKNIPSSGSSYYASKRLRQMVNRARALLWGAKGEYRRSTSLLRRAFDGLLDGHPDDAFFAGVDLIYFYVKTDQPSRALAVCETVLNLRSGVRISLRPEAVALLRLAVQRDSISEAQIIEIRSLLYPA